MKQEIKDGRGNIQVSGDGNNIVQTVPDFEPDPQNPNLINCPACNRYGVYRLADVCPKCGYKLEKVRLAEQEKVRGERSRFIILAVSTIAAIAINTHTFFHLDAMRSLAAGVAGALVLYALQLHLRATIANIIRKKRDNH